MSKKSTVGICMTEDVLKIIDSAIKKTDFKSRSEFISEAIMWYLAKLNANDISKVLSPAVESTIRSASQKCEKNVTTELYRYNLVIGYGIFYTYVISTTESPIAFTYILPVTSLLVLYKNKKYG